MDAEIDNIAKGRSPQRQQFHDRNQPHKKGGEPVNKKRQMKNSKYGEAWGSVDGERSLWIRAEWLVIGGGQW